VNEIKINGTIQQGPDFRTVDATGSMVARFILCCGSTAQTIPVIASRAAAMNLGQFSTGDSVFVAGALSWAGGQLEIMADEIRAWKISVYQREVKTDKRKRATLKTKRFVGRTGRQYIELEFAC
jgi:hypothetical protein